MRDASRVMRYALCVMRYALCVMRYALCMMRYALCVMRYASGAVGRFLIQSESQAQFPPIAENKLPPHSAVKVTVVSLQVGAKSTHVQARSPPQHGHGK